MNVAFYLCAAVAIAATAVVIGSRNAVHALLYLIVSLLAIAGVFVTLGAPFAAALEVIVYAGAIMVLFVFVVVLLNVTPETLKRESEWLQPRAWIGPAILSIILLIGLAIVLGERGTPLGGTPIQPRDVGATLFSTYLLGVEMASMLLLAGLIGAYHLGHRSLPEEEKRELALRRRPSAENTPSVDVTTHGKETTDDGGVRADREVGSGAR